MLVFFVVFGSFLVSWLVIVFEVVFGMLKLLFKVLLSVRNVLILMLRIMI